MEDTNTSKNTATPTSDDDLMAQFKDLLNMLSSIKSQISMLSSKVKSVEKNVKKKMKKLQKEALKNKNKGNRKASGFATPTKISKDLCKFMGKPEGSEMARTEVTKYIIHYIKTNNLLTSRTKRLSNQIRHSNLFLKLRKMKKLPTLIYRNI